MRVVVGCGGDGWVVAVRQGWLRCAVTVREVVSDGDRCGAGRVGFRVLATSKPRRQCLPTSTGTLADAIVDASKTEMARIGLDIDSLQISSINDKGVGYSRPSPPRTRRARP